MIIFENPNILVIDKRPGYLSVLSRMGENDPRPCEFTEYRKKLGVPLWSVHRLDEEVSGLLVLAKNPRAHSLLSQAFESRGITKTYEAWTEKGEGEMPPYQIRQHWESRLLRGKKRAYEKPFGKLAVTEAVLKGKVTYEGREILEWDFFPLTGRSHQLRYECFKHGTPIVGDSLYGAKAPFREKSIALRALALEFRDPTVVHALKIPSRLEATKLSEWLSSSVNAD